jgi:phage baseplate assembly protein W
MINVTQIKKYSDDWALDASYNLYSVVEIKNVQVINQSIEMILATPIGTRLFNLNFGSNFSIRIFDNMNPAYLQTVIDDTVNKIEMWEDRILVLKDDVNLSVNPDSNEMFLTIPYIIKARNIKGSFAKYIKE